jgi:protein-tyrosine phosphatase
MMGGVPGFNGLRSSVDRVAGGLWMGSAPDPSSHLDFDTLVLCAKEYQPRGKFSGLEVIHVPLDDSGVPMLPQEKHGAMVAARQVAMRLREGKRVLVTCAAGLNRSGLVSALAMGMLGATAAVAIESVRRARGPRALSNPYFVSFVERPVLRG